MEKLKKEDCLDWLNYRVKLSQMGNANRYDGFDVNVISKYISHRTNKTVPDDAIKQSILVNHPEVLQKRLDAVINWMIGEFKIQTKTKSVQIGTFERMMDIPEGEIIVEYY